MTIETITPQACHERLQAGQVVDLVDVRTPGEFHAVHAAAARCIPLDRLTAAVVDPAKPVILICKSGSRARRAAETLSAAGRTDVSIVEGGTDAWAAAGLPCVRGLSAVMSLERQVRIVAGSLVAVGVILGYFLHVGFLALSLFVGCGLVFAGVTDSCGMAMLLARLPWNRSCSACRP